MFKKRMVPTRQIVPLSGRGHYEKHLRGGKYAIINGEIKMSLIDSPEDMGTYDPLQDAEELITVFGSLNTDNEVEVLEFFKKWGSPVEHYGGRMDDFIREVYRAKDCLRVYEALQKLDYESCKKWIFNEEGEKYFCRSLFTGEELEPPFFTYYLIGPVSNTKFELGFLETPINKIKDGDYLTLAEVYLCNQINEHLGKLKANLDTYRIDLEDPNSRPIFTWGWSLEGAPLLTYIYLHFANLLSSMTPIRTCKICGKPGVAKTNRWTMHPECAVRERVKRFRHPQ